MFACLSNLKQSCRELYVEQKLFYGHLMKMCTTCSKMVHKSVLRLDSTLRKFLSMKLSFQFHELNFGMILLSILFELDFEL